VLKSFSQIPLGQFQWVVPLRSLALPVRVTSAGYSEETTTAYDWDGLRRGRSEFTLFQWTVSGRGRLTFAGESFDVRPGQAMVLPIPHAHRYFLPRDSPHWRFFYLCLHGTAVPRLTGEFLRDRGPVWSLAPESAPVRLAVRIYELGRRNELGNSFQASALAYEFLMALGAEKDPANDPVSGRFAEVLAFIESNHGEEIQVGELAGVAGMSRFHFTRQFTQALGTSPGDYLLQTRVRHAARLLADPRLSIKEIAGRSGFRSANYLGKVFRRVLGVSPRQFRNSGMYSNRLR